MTLGVMTIEDIPQLVLNCIYLDSRGFAGADGIAVFSFVMSLLSIASNLVLLWYEQGKVAEVTSYGGHINNPIGQLRDVVAFSNPTYSEPQNRSRSQNQTATCAHSRVSGGVARDCTRNAEPGSEYCDKHGCPTPGCAKKKGRGDTTCVTCAGMYIDVGGPEDAYGGFDNVC